MSLKMFATGKETHPIKTGTAEFYRNLQSVDDMLLRYTLWKECQQQIKAQTHNTKDEELKSNPTKDNSYSIR